MTYLRWGIAIAVGSAVGALASVVLWLFAIPSAASETNLSEPLVRSSSEEELVQGDVPASGAASGVVTEASSVPLSRTAETHFQGSLPKHWGIGRQVVLLLGLDRGPGKPGTGLTDTIVAVIMDGDHEQIGLLSVPRDLFVEIPDHRPDRINTVYAVARRTKIPPLRLLQRVFMDTLALPVNHIVAVDLGVLEKGIDVLGGVAVGVPCAIVDDFVDGRTESGRRLLSVPAGNVTMDGVTAAMYIRSRHGRSDWSRARRQQAVMMGIRARLGTVDGMRKLPELWTLLESSLGSDMTRLELLQLARRLAAVDSERLHGVVLGAQHTEQWRTPDGRAVLLPRTEAIRRSIDAVFDAPAPGFRDAKIGCPAAAAALRSGPASTKNVSREAQSDQRSVQNRSAGIVAQ